MTLPADFLKPDPKPGRDASGRFAKGNAEGKGNPFARRVAGLRAALLEEIDDAKFRQMVRDLVQMALDKDLAAIKLVLQYVLGKPAEMVNPDDLDRLEFEQLQRDAVALDEVNGATGASIPANLASTLVKIIVPLKGQQFADASARTIETGKPPSPEDFAPPSADEPEATAPEAAPAEPEEVEECDDAAPAPAVIHVFGAVNKRGEPARKAANRGRSPTANRRKKKGKRS